MTAEVGTGGAEGVQTCRIPLYEYCVALEVEKSLNAAGLVVVEIPGKEFSGARRNSTRQ